MKRKKGTSEAMTMSKQTLEDNNCQVRLTNECARTNEKDVYII
jgi:hypothetical protein